MGRPRSAPEMSQETAASIYLDRWRPRASWASHLAPAVRALATSQALEDVLPALRRAAMMLGDAGAAPLCLFVCLYGQRLLPADALDRRLASHRDLCLLDLGLARAPGESVAIAALGDDDCMDRDGDALARWLAFELTPFAGSLADAARFAVRLAAIRTGLYVGAPPTSVVDVLDDSRWTLAG
ncbi:MAG: hypothetical protein KC636_24725 [Myxococcales bacterium]|nr:hypothetical protein [Myxococcales bacterium]